MSIEESFSFMSALLAGQMLINLQGGAGTRGGNEGMAQAIRPVGRLKDKSSYPTARFLHRSMTSESMSDWGFRCMNQIRKLSVDTQSSDGKADQANYDQKSKFVDSGREISFIGLHPGVRIDQLTVLVGLHDVVDHGNHILKPAGGKVKSP